MVGSEEDFWITEAVLSIFVSLASRIGHGGVRWVNGWMGVGKKVGGGEIYKQVDFHY